MKDEALSYSFATFFKINALTLLGFGIWAGATYFLTNMLYAQFKQSLLTFQFQTGFAMLQYAIGLLGMAAFAWLLYCMAITACIPMYPKFFDNIKSISGLICCNVFIAYVLYNKLNYQVAIYGVSPVLFIILITLLWRYAIARINYQEAKAAAERRMLAESPASKNA